MVFNFDDYKGKYVMHCKTNEEAEDFCRVMHKHWRKWSKNKSYIGKTNWEDYKTDTCYDFNTGEYAYINSFERNYYTILEWGDFMKKEFTKADLRSGMVGITREGERYVFLCGKFRNCDGMTYWGNDADLNNDFTNRIGNDSSDFVRICITSAETLEDWCKDGYLTTVWERNETTELTMNEIKDRLGISGELKIVEK